MNGTNETQPAPYLQVQNISIHFGSTQALDHIDFQISPGEIIGLIGANGAGKSTLMKIITGIYRQDSGQIIYPDKVFEPEDSYNANQARNHGIYCAYQELPCCTNLKVYENFLLNSMSHFPLAKPGWRKKGLAETMDILDRVFPDHGISGTSVMETLPMMQRQMIEICKAINHGNLKILVLDEPTSYLTTERIEQLHIYLRQLSQKGIAVVYISHKLDEIQQICSSVTIMRNGKKECTREINEISKDEIISFLGGNVSSTESKVQNTGKKKTPPLLLDIQDFNRGPLHNINMQIYKGEILGISGLDGGGQSDLLRALFDTVGKKAKISYVSGNRAAEGVFPLWNIGRNIAVSSLSQIDIGTHGIVFPGKAASYASKWFDKLSVKANSVHDDITSLSGGNQQKALIARGLAANSDIILLNDPTCGVDIGTKQEIYRFMHEAKEAGKTIILFSTEDYEMCECDRVYIMHEGTIVEEIGKDNLSEEAIIQTAFKWKSETRLKKEDDMTPEKHPFFFKSITNSRAGIAICTFLIIYIIIGILRPVAFSYRGFNLLYAATIPLVMAGLSQMFVAIGGGIDMGNGMAIGTINVAMACIASVNTGLGIAVCIGMIIIYGLMGMFIYRTRIPAVIVTLGMSFIWKGVSLIISPIPQGICPAWLKAIFDFRPLGITGTVLFPFLALLVSFWITKRSKYGIVMNASGNNEVVTQRAGWSAALGVTVSYATAGLFAVIAGLSITAITGSGDYNCGSTYPLMSVAVFILGGCEFIGAFSSPTGVVIAAFAMSSITNLLTFAGINSNYTMLFTGIVLILAMIIKHIMKQWRQHT